MDNPRNKFMLNSTFDRANQLQQMLATEVKDSLSYYNFFRKKSKLGAVTDVPPQLTRGKIAPLLNVTWPKYHFAVKTTNRLPYVLLNLLAML